MIWFWSTSNASIDFRRFNWQKIYPEVVQETRGKRSDGVDEKENGPVTCSSRGAYNKCMNKNGVELYMNYD